MSATALVVVLLRSLQLAQMAGQTGAQVGWKPILATQASFWVTWSIWAGVSVPLMRRLIEHPPRTILRVGSLIGLALLPSILVPIPYGLIHWLTFGGGQSFGFGYIHTATHDVITNVLLGTAIAGVTYGYLGLQRARHLEVTAAHLNAQLSKAQLDTLRAQLNPHFLFNALNSIAVLARRGQAADVERMVTQLAGLLRHALESSKEQVVTMRVELEALRQYLAIEQVRYRDRLVVTVDVPDVLLDRVVPSLLLQPLVENGIRHGFVDGSQPLHVAVRARVEAARLILSVVDDGPGPAHRDDPPEGLGLGNTRARLAGLYGSGASLTLAPADHGHGAKVTVVLPDRPL